MPDMFESKNAKPMLISESRAAFDSPDFIYELKMDGERCIAYLDPLSGTVLDLGRTRYRPTTALADHVVARDRTCVRPGCGVPAESCDLDHTREFHGSPGGSGDATELGTTSADNLGPLCRRHHRLKTDGGFVLRQESPGVFEWLTPTGHRYRCVPGLDPALAGRPPPSDPSPPPPPF